MRTILLPPDDLDQKVSAESPHSGRRMNRPLVCLGGGREGGYGVDFLREELSFYFLRKQPKTAFKAATLDVVNSGETEEKSKVI